MKNRSRYITQRNEYDMLMNILRRSVFDCPIYVISDISGKEKNKRCEYYDCRQEGNTACSKCIQAWLNEEEKKT